MFISDLFEDADCSTTPKITEAKDKISASEDSHWADHRMVGAKSKVNKEAIGYALNKKSTINEDSHLADVITARDLINRAVQNPDSKHEYFNFLKHLRTKHGNEYSTSVHQQAAKLSKGNS